MVDPRKITPWLALAIYSIILFGLLRPGGPGQALVGQFGSQLADVVAGV